MCAEKFNFQKIARRNAMCTWRELGRSTDSFEDYLEAKMRQIRFYL